MSYIDDNNAPDKPENELPGPPTASGDNTEAKLEVERLEKPASTAVLTLGGFLYLKKAKVLIKEVTALVRDGFTNIIFDMSDVKYMNSSAVAALANGAATVEGHGGKAVLVSLTPTIEKVLTTLGLIGMFLCLPTKEEAISALS